MATSLRKLVEVFGAAWAKKSILPKIVAMGSEKVYLSRLTALFAIASIADLLDTPVATKDALPVVIKLAADPVPNVRFNAARTIQALIPKIDAGLVFLSLPSSFALAASPSPSLPPFLSSPLSPFRQSPI